MNKQTSKQTNRSVQLKKQKGTNTSTSREIQRRKQSLVDMLMLAANFQLVDCNPVTGSLYDEGRIETPGGSSAIVVVIMAVVVSVVVGG